MFGNKFFTYSAVIALGLVALFFLATPGKSASFYENFNIFAENADICYSPVDVEDLNQGVEFITHLTGEELAAVNTFLGSEFDHIDLYDAGDGFVYVVYFYNSCFQYFEIVALEDVLNVIDMYSEDA